MSDLLRARRVVVIEEDPAHGMVVYAKPFSLGPASIFSNCCALSKKR